MKSFSALTVALVAVLLSTGLVAPLFAQQYTYKPVPDFLQFPADLKLGEVPGVAFNSQGHIIVTHRGAQPILVFDKDGKFLRSFGDEHLDAVHGTRVDADDNLWVTDMRNHTVIKFSPEGKVLLKLGERDVPGVDEEHFNRPTDIAFGENGNFFVSDGYGNNRVVKFDKQGKFLQTWGEDGGWKGLFRLPHCAFVDGQGRLHISDRENDRIQVFNQEGEFLWLYGGFAPFGVFIADDDTVYVADGRDHKVYRMTLRGQIIAQWGSEGTAPGQFQLPHGITVDPQGAVYVTEITGKRIQKFVPVAE